MNNPDPTSRPYKKPYGGVVPQSQKSQRYSIENPYPGAMVAKISLDVPLGWK